jgi:hypothetical protein
MAPTDGCDYFLVSSTQFPTASWPQGSSVVERCMGQEGVPSGEVSPQPGDSVAARRTGPSQPVKASRRDGPRPPTHQGSGLPLGAGSPSRAESWAAMSETIRGRLAELAGEVLEWFAEQDSSGENRPRAVVLGTQALCIAEPRIDSAGRPVYVLNRYEFVPGTHKKIPVEYRPGLHESTKPPDTPQRGASLPQPESDLGLSLREAGQLGNLPPMAQELLQAPFNSKHRIIRCEYWYSGYPHRLDKYMLVLAGRHFVTAAIGTQQVPVGHTVANAHWNLTCHRIAVNRVVGS